MIELQLFNFLPSIEPMTPILHNFILVVCTIICDVVIEINTITHGKRNDDTDSTIVSLYLRNESVVSSVFRSILENYVVMRISLMF